MKKSVVILVAVCLSLGYVSLASAITYRALQKIKEQEGQKKECTCMHEGYLFSMYHYPKFFGDKNTRFGRFAERSFLLTGTSDSWRSKCARNGVYLDATVYQFLGTNAAGGNCRGDVRYSGNGEYWALFDMGQMNFWSKGAFLLRGESSWLANTSINNDVGSVIKSNTKSGPNNSRLAEFMLAQFLTDSFVFRLGKLDICGPFEATDFANNSRFQFIYDALTNNPIIFTFANNDVPLGFMPTWVPSENHQIMLFIGDTRLCENESSFDPLFNHHPTFLAQYTFSPKFGDLPGNYRAVYTFARKPITEYALPQECVLCADVGTLATGPYCSNNAFMINFDQYVWRNEANDVVPYRNFLPDLGVMLFGRAGWAPDDRNVVDAFYSIGLGCYGGPKGRYYDQWGIGYAATHLACPMRAQLHDKGYTLHTYEHAVEFFYNAEVTPALHFTADLQVVRPPLTTRKTAFVINTRLQADF